MKDNKRGTVTIRDVLGFLIAICGIFIIIFIFTEPLLYQKEKK